MQTVWSGDYLDGRTATQHSATVELAPTGLSITLQNGEILRWPYAEMRQTQGSYAGEPVRLERRGQLAETLVVPDAAFLLALKRMAPESSGRFHNPRYRRVRARLVVLAALGAITIAGALYTWGIPTLARVATSMVPLSWEVRLGDEVIDGVAPADRRCSGRAGLQAIGEIVSTLASHLPAPPRYRFRPVVVDSPVVNAFALPGGYIVVFRGLLAVTQSPEELAAVLSHEMAHVVQRHGTRLLVEHASLRVLVRLLSGDGSGVAYPLDAARMLGTLRYSRRHEDEADVDGMRLMARAGVDPAAIVKFLEALPRAAPDTPAALTYLSTHPSSQERVARLRGLATELAGPVRPLLSDRDWREVEAMCAVGPR